MAENFFKSVFVNNKSKPSIKDFLETSLIKDNSLTVTYRIEALHKYAPETHTIKEFVANVTGKIFNALISDKSGIGIKSTSDAVLKLIRNFFEQNNSLIRKLRALEDDHTSFVGAAILSVCLFEVIIEIIKKVKSEFSNPPNLIKLENDIEFAIDTHYKEIYDVYLQKNGLPHSFHYTNNELHTALAAITRLEFRGPGEQPKSGKKKKMTKKEQKIVDQEIENTMGDAVSTIETLSTNWMTTREESKKKTCQLKEPSLDSDEPPAEIVLNSDEEKNEKSENEEEEKDVNPLVEMLKFDVIRESSKLNLPVQFLNKKRFTEGEWEMKLIKDEHLKDESHKALVLETFYEFATDNKIPDGLFETNVEMLWRRYCKKKLNLPENIYEATVEQQDLYKNYVHGNIEAKITHFTFFNFLENKLNEVVKFDNESFFALMKEDIEKFMPDWLILFGQLENTADDKHKKMLEIQQRMKEELACLSASCTFPPDRMVRVCPRKECGKEQTGLSIGRWCKPNRKSAHKYPFYDTPAFLPCKECIKFRPPTPEFLCQKNPLTLKAIQEGIMVGKKHKCKFCGRFYQEQPCQHCKEPPVLNLRACIYCKKFISKKNFAEHYKHCWTRKYIWYKSFPIKDETARRYLFATGKRCIGCGDIVQKLSRHQKTCKEFLPKLGIYPLKQCGNCKKDFIECIFYVHVCSGAFDLIKCEKCDKLFESVVKWSHHMNGNGFCANNIDTVVKLEAIRCKHCDRTFASKFEYEPHITSAAKGHPCLYAKTRINKSGNGKTLVDDGKIYRPSGNITHNTVTCEWCNKERERRNFRRCHINWDREGGPTCKVLNLFWKDNNKPESLKKYEKCNDNMLVDDAVDSHQILPAPYTPTVSTTKDQMERLHRHHSSVLRLVFSGLILFKFLSSVFCMLLEIHKRSTAYKNFLRSLAGVIKTYTKDWFAFFTINSLTAISPQYDIGERCQTRMDFFFYSSRHDGDKQAVKVYRNLKCVQEIDIGKLLAVMRYSNNKYENLRSLPIAYYNDSYHAYMHHMNRVRQYCYLYYLILEIPRCERPDLGIDNETKDTLYYKLQRVIGWSDGEKNPKVKALDYDWDDFLCYQKMNTAELEEKKRLQQCIENKQAFIKRREVITEFKSYWKNYFGLEDDEELNQEELRLVYQGIVNVNPK